MFSDGFDRHKNRFSLARANFESSDETLPEHWQLSIEMATQHMEEFNNIIADQNASLSEKNLRHQKLISKIWEFFGNGKSLDTPSPEQIASMSKIKKIQIDQSDLNPPEIFAHATSCNSSENPAITEVTPVPKTSFLEEEPSYQAQRPPQQNVSNDQSSLQLEKNSGGRKHNQAIRKPFIKMDIYSLQLEELECVTDFDASRIPQPNISNPEWLNSVRNLVLVDVLKFVYRPHFIASSFMVTSLKKWYELSKFINLLLDIGFISLYINHSNTQWNKIHYFMNFL